jgi:hypothetical protein
MRPTTDAGVSDREAGAVEPEESAGERAGSVLVAKATTAVAQKNRERVRIVFMHGKPGSAPIVSVGVEEVPRRPLGNHRTGGPSELAAVAFLVVHASGAFSSGGMARFADWKVAFLKEGG